MEANEVQELQEHAEDASHESSMMPVALTMTILAVLVAVVTVLGHRTHTEAILNQTRAAMQQNVVADDWAFYQAKKIRSNDTELTADLMSVLSIANKDEAKKKAKSYADHEQKWTADLKDGEEKAREDESKVREFEQKVEENEKRADHFDLGEALLEIGLVITSITLLTKKRIYWYVGMGASVVGIVATVFGLLLK
jgi:cell fate (sporulation/competence/biofilm development) regulator YlbF (YheA/YmcA/DUF963 family)